MRKIKILSLPVIFAVILIGIFVYHKFNAAAGNGGVTQQIQISKGMSVSEMGKVLAESKIIKNPFYFSLYFKITGNAEKIKAGTYLFSDNMPISEISNLLTQGKAANLGKQITFLEGWNIEDFSEALVKHGIINHAEEFKKHANSSNSFVRDFDFLTQLPTDSSLEGYLFPDTYVFTPGLSEEEIIKRMLGNFESKTRGLREASGGKFHDIVILASIIEREVGRNVKQGQKLTEQDFREIQAERRNVASVFYNRLAIGMRLESDATVTYITKRKSPRATIEETKIDSPYNTYRNVGLPPGPISNPSLNALEAAVNPSNTDFLYFLTDPLGRAYFAKDWEGHQRNREKYLR